MDQLISSADKGPASSKKKNAKVREYVDICLEDGHEGKVEQLQQLVVALILKLK